MKEHKIIIKILEKVIQKYIFRRIINEAQYSRELKAWGDEKVKLNEALFKSEKVVQAITKSFKALSNKYSLVCKELNDLQEKVIGEVENGIPNNWRYALSLKDEGVLKELIYRYDDDSYWVCRFCGAGYYNVHGRNCGLPPIEKYSNMNSYIEAIVELLKVITDPIPPLPPMDRPIGKGK